jgi:hypothetical protein
MGQIISEASHWSNILSSSAAGFAPCLRQHGTCLFKLAFVKAAPGQGGDGGFLPPVHQNNYICFGCGVVIAMDALENQRNRRGRYRNGQG